MQTWLIVVLDAFVVHVCACARVHRAGLFLIIESLVSSTGPGFQSISLKLRHFVLYL